MWMIRDFPRAPDRLPELSRSRAQQSEVFKTMTGVREPYNLGGSAIGVLLSWPPDSPSEAPWLLLDSLLLVFSPLSALTKSS